MCLFWREFKITTNLPAPQKISKKYVKNKFYETIQSNFILKKIMNTEEVVYRGGKFGRIIPGGGPRGGIPNN